MIEQIGRRLTREGYLESYEAQKAAARTSRVARHLIKRLDESHAANVLVSFKEEVFPETQIEFMPLRSNGNKSKDYLGVALQGKREDAYGQKLPVRIEIRSVRGHFWSGDIMQLAVGNVETWLLPEQYMNRGYMQELILAQLDQRRELPVHIAKKSAIQHSPLRHMYHGRALK